jgi:NAD-dependent dihydropyrimidine dehydrogenase PreA subunit
MSEPLYAVPQPGIFTPVTIHEELCIGCNLCVFVCQADLFLPSATKGGAPLVVYGGECWFEGSCVDHCPVPGAIELNTLLFNRVRWKEAGGMSTPPAN